ncbi:helix-hairpin-helix domain-containing protein [Garciella nitratireducens]|uniref:Competence protein ComEA n=1 Tax=Garciella nitratireducens DSM 15102 TaxID=1121911 RepID=A0A1T4KT83_9FIRM|nr:helix-hairpin-helix domain-containing protein [Garciella nitratireducens]RBP39565.1 competence protein ComEA [Garciella nitratireducens]SJZ45621.1 competence protein ComEA [Garciella nitratireducens DSM 15102]
MREFIKGKKIFFIVSSIVILIIGAMVFHFQKSNDKILMIDQSKEEQFENTSEELEQQENPSTIEKEEVSEKEQSSQEIMVHIVGQVKYPGVVEVPEGTRLIEAIEQLGGITQQADLNAVNLSKKLIDEEKIYIPKKGEIPQEDIIFQSNINNSANSNISQEENSAKININTADQEQLKTLPGIGDTLSKNIIEYREIHGGFKSIEEIKDVNRIGDKIFNELKEKITI